MCRNQARSHLLHVCFEIHILPVLGHYRGSRGFPWVYLSVEFPMTEMWRFHGALFDFCLKPVSQRSQAPCCPKRCNERVLWSACQCTNTLNGSGQELRAVCHGHKDGKIGPQDRTGGRSHHCFRAHLFAMFLLPSMFSSPTISTRISSEPYPSMTCCHTRGPMAFTAVHKYRILSIYWHDPGLCVHYREPPSKETILW